MSKGKRVQQILDKDGTVLTSKELRDNYNFVQLYRTSMASVRSLIGVDSQSAILYFFIIENMDNENALMVSNECLAEIFDCSTRTIIRRVNMLKDGGFLKTLKSGTSNVYIVNANVAWTAGGEKKEFAKFRASVLLSKSEQEHRIQASKFKTVDVK